MRALLLCVALSSFAFAANARADGPNAAEVLFREGKTLLDNGQLEQACRVLEESNRLEPAGGTLLNLASCYERLGRYASAEKTLSEARKLAEAAGREDAKSFIEQRLSAVAPNVSVVRVSLGERDWSKTSLEVDSVPVPLRGTSAELRLDPGAHELRVDTQGLPVWRHKVSLQGAGAVVEVEVDGAQPTPPPPLPVIAPAPREARPAATIGAPDGGLTPLQITGIVGMAVGGGVLLAGSVIGGLAIDAWSDASARCPQPDCSDEVGVARSQDAVEYGNVATGLIVSGAVVALAGGAFYLISTLQSAGAPKRARWELNTWRF